MSLSPERTSQSYPVGDNTISISVPYADQRDVPMIQPQILDTPTLFTDPMAGPSQSNFAYAQISTTYNLNNSLPKQHEAEAEESNNILRKQHVAEIDELNGKPTYSFPFG